ncbi:MAG: UDP-N-acetylglucosamine 1-carboxyvinyltransferase [Eubacteriaceae bacterium]|nr:UDP-N-acetylglucosamine 1-carboxyvinyltransferase [Eubacteriaceae bacterium]
MEKLIIKGRKSLKGEIVIAGAKNAALGILPACILSDEICRIENLPDIIDIKNYISILRCLGAEVTYTSDRCVEIDAQRIGCDDTSAANEEIRNMRASYYLIGALLGKCKYVNIPLPGGCDIGTRPIDQHIKGFRALGAEVSIENGKVKAKAKELKGATIFLDVVSVGATINIMLAAVKAKGITTIENAAKEPHVVDIANFLNLMGAQIKGAGTEVIRINGVETLRKCDYMVIPDQIVAGTYMLASAVTCGDVLVKNIIPKHMESLSAKLLEMGVSITEYDDAIRVVGTKSPKPANIKTAPYPGFPTDLQQPMAVLMCLAKGVSTINENVFESRFKYLDEIRKMGVEISVNGRTSLIIGNGKLSGCPLKATDLRAGAAMVLAGLAADGVTEITDLHHIDRGYEDMEGNLRALGADIKRITIEE